MKGKPLDGADLGKIFTVTFQILLGIHVDITHVRKAVESTIFQAQGNGNVSKEDALSVLNCEGHNIFNSKKHYNFCARSLDAKAAMRAFDGVQEFLDQPDVLKLHFVNPVSYRGDPKQKLCDSAGLDSEELDHSWLGDPSDYDPSLDEAIEFLKHTTSSDNQRRPVATVGGAGASLRAGGSSSTPPRAAAYMYSAGGGGAGASLRDGGSSSTPPRAAAYMYSDGGGGAGASCFDQDEEDDAEEALTYSIDEGVSYAQEQYRYSQVNEQRRLTALAGRTSAVRTGAGGSGAAALYSAGGGGTGSSIRGAGGCSSFAGGRAVPNVRHPQDPLPYHVGASRANLLKLHKKPVTPDWGTRHTHKDSSGDRVPWEKSELVYLFTLAEHRLNQNPGIRKLLVSKLLAYIKQDPSAYPIFHKHHVISNVHLRNGYRRLTIMAERVRSLEGLSDSIGA